MHSYNPIVLSQPLQNKKLYRQGNVMFRVGAATMQGWRCTMEDTHVTELSLPNHPDTGFFAVYDGHGGLTTSRYLSENFHKEIDNLQNVHCKSEIIKTAVEVDTQLMAEKNTFRNGSTAVFAIVDMDQKHKNQYLLTLGNIGDSRAILIKGGKKGIALTKDHLPTNRRERTRIQRAGGLVKDGRVRGELAVSRSFGDAALKLPTVFPPCERMVIPLPDIRATTVTSDDILLLTCDGIYEKDLVFNLDTVSKFIIDDLRTTDDLAMTCAHLLDACLERKSYDNMTAILIQFKDGSDYHQEEIDYRPGPYHEGARNADFRRAYILDAKLAGYTVKQARMKYEMTEELKNDSSKIHRVQRRNSESEALLSSKEKIMSESGYESDDENHPKCNQTRRKSEHIRTKEHIYINPHHQLEEKPILNMETQNNNNNHSEVNSLQRIKSTGEIQKERKSKHVTVDTESSPKVSHFSRRKLHSPNKHSESSNTIMRRPKNEHSEDEHLTSDNEFHHHSDISSNESPVLSRNTSNGDISLQKSAPKILHHLRHRKKKDHKTPPDLEHICPEASSPEFLSEEELKGIGSAGVDRTKIVTQKKSKSRKNRSVVNEDISRDESEDGSCDHECSELSDSHKKHYFHFPPILHSLWNHKRSNSHKKERDGEHLSEHDTEIIDKVNVSAKRDRHRDSEPHRRHTLSPRLPTFFDENPPVVSEDKNEIMTKN